jgi:hypothetical protein
MSPEDRAKLIGFGPTNLTYIERLINGEPVELVAKDVPVATRKPHKSHDVETRTRATDLPLNVDFSDLEDMLEELSRLRKEYSAKFGCLLYPGLAEGSFTREIALLSRAIDTGTPFTTWSGCE